MKRGAMLINTSRGGLLNIKDVICGLRLGKLGSLGIDVYESEEKIFFKDFSNLTVEEKMLYWDDTMAQLSSLPQVLVTPHQAFLTHEALTEIAECTKQNILEFARENAEELDDAENDDARTDVSNTTRVC
jgi:D-lactate dehydrogenase